MLPLLALSLVVSANPAVTSPGYVFITTATGTGNFSTWAEAGGMTGLAAGDAICSAEAAAANLDLPGDYIAAVSDSNNDLYCRAHGLPGKVAANCGQATLPAFAGPWLRRDGQLFATLDTLRNDNAAIEPPRFRADLSDGLADISYNGTRRGMIFDTASGACADWTSNATQNVLGTAGGSTAGYFENSTFTCNQVRHLECIARGQRTAVVVARPSGRQAFVTLAHGSGNLSTWADAGGASGIAAGDAVCQAEASAGGLAAPDSFKAWLSDSVVPLNAIDRFVNDGPWVRTDGVLVAASKTTLSSVSTMTTAPTTLATGAFPVVTTFPWTGSNNSGAASSVTCGGWNSTSGTGTAGFIGALNYWTNITQANCTSSFNTLYCFSDLDRIFDGGMEAIPY